MFPIKNLENVSKRIKRKTQSPEIASPAQRIYSQGSEYRVHSSGAPVEPAAPLEKLGPACSVLISSQKLYSTRSPEMEPEKAILSRLGSEGF